ncbi:topoisomerase II-associated protein PAT1 [Xylariaceae sp. FL0804]|nr:topoisomerase II-associated protein PAT1 [Xylariaceae sp. FL0804]
MSFNTGSSGHDPAAPGFGQTYDPFAGLSGNHDDIDEALNFEDTYDRLGDQLDETDDAFNDDTFGGTGSSQAPVGRDFDFFGQTAGISTAIDEEHARFSRQQPQPKSAHPIISQDYSTGYSYQPPQRPARTGYEKYKEPEPVAALEVDAAIWGSAPKKAPAQPSMAPAPPSAESGSRKMMSLEEVEAAMRAQARPALGHSQFGVSEPQGPVLAPLHEPSHVTGQQAEPRQVQGYQAGDHQPGVQGVASGQPITILQRPPPRHIAPHAPGVPSSLSQQHASQPSVAPTQILRNPNRLSAERTARGDSFSHPSNRAQHPYSRQPHPITTAAGLSELSEQEKTAFLEAEARRAKRNHKIYMLSRDNGLMTPQDKSFITRIQLQQLVSATGDPSEPNSDAALNEDFYYQVLSSLRAGQRPNPNQPLTNFAQTYLFQTGSRHGGMRRHGRGGENHVQRMEQQVQRAVEAAKNKPKNKQLVIEGSLGKISFSNAKTPKPLLNIKRTDSSNDVNRPGSGHRSQPISKEMDKKTTLKDIEGVYATLMKMEDLERTMPPPESDGQLGQEFLEKQAEFQGLNQQLWKNLKVHEPISSTTVHPFITFMSYAKGKKAIQRVFRHLTPTQRTTILTMIVIHLDQLDVIRGAQVQTGEPIMLNAATRDSIKLFSSAVMPSLFQLLNESELDIVTGVLGLITQNINVDLVARTRIGISMLTMILSRAELVKQAGHADEQTWQQWVSTFNQFFNALEPTLPNIFPGTVTSGEDIYVWQFLAAIGIGASPDEQQRLVLAVKDRVMDTVNVAKTLPPDLAKERRDSVNLFMRSIGLDVELLNQ